MSEQPGYTDGPRGMAWLPSRLALEHGLVEDMDRSPGELKAYDLDDDLMEDSDLVFHIGQNYGEHQRTKAMGVKCAICGSDQFNVGRDDYYTAIRCVTCGWEYCIHEG